VNEQLDCHKNHLNKLLDEKGNGIYTIVETIQSSIQDARED